MRTPSLFLAALLLALFGFSCARQVRWNQSVLAKTASTSQGPASIVVPIEGRNSDPEQALEVLSKELSKAGFVVERSLSSGGRGGQGSAFYVTAEGHLVTAAHVVGPFDEMVVLVGKQEVRARVLAVDVPHDLALLKVDLPPGAGVLPLAFGEASERALGADAYALGFPMSDLFGQSPTVTKGVVNSDEGVAGDRDMFKISAELQPGSSGGPLVSSDGRLLGIAVGTLNPSLIVLMEGKIPQNVNFGVKAELVRDFLARNGITAGAANVPRNAAPDAPDGGASPSVKYASSRIEAVSGIALVKRPEPAGAQFIASVEYLVGPQGHYGYTLRLVDLEQGELVMMDTFGSGRSPGGAVRSFVHTLRQHPFFAASVNAAEASARAAVRDSDSAYLLRFRSSFDGCVQALSAMGRRSKVHLDVGAYISPAGAVRSPAVWAKAEGMDQIVSTDTRIQTVECASRVMEQVQFPPYNAGPRTVYQSFDWANSR